MEEEHENEGHALGARERKNLFLEMASRPEGTTALEVHKKAVSLGDTVTEESYYNLARRLVHRGILIRVDSGHAVSFKLSTDLDSRWLEEDDLNSLVDPDYPLIALSIWKESRRQINEIPEEVWVELRERLRGESAQNLFFNAIVSYCDDFHAQIAMLVELENQPTPDLPHLRQEAENSRQLLLRLGKYGLGLSSRALNLPFGLDIAISDFKKNKQVSYIDEAALKRELARRVEPASMIVDANPSDDKKLLLVGGVDGSTRSGILSFLGEEGDLAIGHAPMIAINTAVGQVNRFVQTGKRMLPLFIKLPEKPEDMQRQDNRYSVMAKLFYPDLSDAKYMHSVWNAMDLIETKVAVRLLKRWYGPKAGLEVQPCDIVLRDGTIAPQDRDFSHYSEQSSYGKIVRDLMEVNWEIASKCLADGQTVGGVVKEAQLSVFAPVINWFACQIISQKTGQLAEWPLYTMNLAPDQLVLTRLLTAGRKKNDAWMRTCVVLRPFHAVTNYSQNYSGSCNPSEMVLREYREAMKFPENLGQDKKIFWETFRSESDPYVKMLDNAFYGGFFLGAVPRLDIDKLLPRLEFLVTALTNDSEPSPWTQASLHRERLLKAVQEVGFEVSAEHSMFNSAAQLDVLPSILIRAHDTVKIWASELLSRVQEFIGFYLSRYVKVKRFRGIKVRPFSRTELELLYSQLKREREIQAGSSSTQSKRIQN